MPIFKCISCDGQVSLKEAARHIKRQNYCPLCGAKINIPGNASTPETISKNAEHGISKRTQAATGKQPTIVLKLQPKAQLTEEAWLVVQNGATPLQSHKIPEGKQLVGRKSITQPCDIMILTQDLQMSRQHFYISTIPDANGTVQYVLSLNINGLKNPTFHNARQMQPTDEVYLRDKDIILAGATKIEFRFGNPHN